MKNHPRSSNQPSIPTLQSLSLKVFATYIQEYLDSIPMEELHSIIALLPSKTIEELSILISQEGTFNDQILMLLGCHSHINGICIRPNTNVRNDEDDQEGNDGTTATPNRTTVTDNGVLSLIPKVLVVAEEKKKIQHQEDKQESESDAQDTDDDVVDCWEDYDDTSCDERQQQQFSNRIPSVTPHYHNT